MVTFCLPINKVRENFVGKGGHFDMKVHAAEKYCTPLYAEKKKRGTSVGTSSNLIIVCVACVNFTYLKSICKSHV